MMGLTPDVFWSLTPIEFSFISEGYSNKITDDRKDSWDRTRLLAFYIYASIPKKSKTISYKQFCKEHIPLPWDKEEIKEVKDPESVMTLDDWADRIASFNSK